MLETANNANVAIEPRIPFFIGDSKN
jgi:hypothetical protein